MLGGMTVREILKMGDPRLLRVAQPVTEFDTDEIHLLVSDMFDTMRAADGAGLAAPQIGVDLQLVIFGTEAREPALPGRAAGAAHRAAEPGRSRRSAARKRRAGKAACRCPGCAAWCRAGHASATPASISTATPIDRTVEGFHARVVQHECDHLIGKLYPMRVRDFSKFGFTEVLFPGLDAGQDD